MRFSVYCFPRRAVRLRLAALLLFALAVVLGVGIAARAANPSALWHIVHGQCVPDQLRRHNPAPCATVDVARGYAVLKDIRGDYQFLLIPTARVSGIDDPAILAAGAPNYWQYAWQARRYLEQRVGHAVPRTMLSLAINSSVGRSQNQLHIHVDCVRADVRAALERYQRSIGRSWAPFPVPLAGHHYRVMRVEQSEPGTVNPFRLLAASVSAAEMRWHTLVLVGTAFGGRPGFVLLDDRADLAAGNRGSGEELQDHSCSLLR